MGIIIEDDEVERALKGIKEELSNPSKLKSFFKEASIILDKDTKEHFKRELGPSESGEISDSGKRWKGLSERTKEKRRKKGTLSKGILKDSDDLKNSIRKFSNITSGGLETDIVYARTHQEGKRGIPKRAFFWFSKKAVDRIIGALVKRIVKAWYK